MTISGTVLLDRVFISLASNPSQYFSCGSAGAVGASGSGSMRTDTTTLEGTFRNYANFNTRLILGTAKTRVQVLALKALTPAQVSTCQSFMGKTVLFRDTYGRKIWGSYVVTAETDIPLSGKANVDLLTDIGITFQEITYVEGV